MLTRRKFLRTAAILAFTPPLLAKREQEIWVNDVHSQLNRTRVRALLTPRTNDDLIEAVKQAKH